MTQKTSLPKNVRSVTSHDPKKPKKPSEVAVVLFGYRIQPLEFIILFVVLCVLFFGVIMGYRFIVQSIKPEKSAPIAKVEKPKEVKKRVLTKSEQILREKLNLPFEERIIYGHQVATGLERLEGYVLRGKISVSGNTYPLTFYFKRPNRVRREIRSSDLSTFERIDGYNGTDVWTMLTDNSVRQKVAVLTGKPESQAIIESSEIGTHLWRFEKEPQSIAALGQEVNEGVNEFVFSYKTPASTIFHYLDGQSLLENRRRVVKPGVPEGTFVFSDYREIKGVQFAYSLEYLQEGKVFSKTVISEIEVNVGIPLFLFDIPNDIPEAPKR